MLSLAAQFHDSLLLLDDAAARRHATSMGLTYTGTLGILVRATRIGQIQSRSVVLDRLESLVFILHQ